MEPDDDSWLEYHEFDKWFEGNDDEDEYCEDDERFYPCPHCGGSDDSGHANDCPNNPYGYNYFG